MVDFIHIGHQKTGSASLKKVYFTEENNVKLIKPTGDLRIHLFQLINNGLKFDVDLFKSFFVKEYGHKIKSYKKDGYVVGISWSPLSGEMYSGNNAYLICKRLYKIFGKVKILILIRNQLDMIEATYKMYVQTGGVFGIENFLTNKYINFRHDKLYYYEFIRLYQKTFSNDLVFVFLYEEYKEYPDVFLKSIFNCLGLTKPPKLSSQRYANVSPHAYSLILTRIFNFIFNNHRSTSLFGNSIQNIVLFKRGTKTYSLKMFWRRIIIERVVDPYIMVKFFSNRRVLSSNHIKVISSIYKDSNKKTAKLLNIDLQKYKYPY